METPEFKPRRPLTRDTDYKGNVRQYGPAPKGYRWMKVGEKINNATDLYAASGKVWSVDKFWKEVNSLEWPWITPLEKVPKTDKISLLEAEVAKARAALAAAEKKLSTARELAAKLEAL